MGRGEDPHWSASFSVAPEASLWSPRGDTDVDLNCPFDRWENRGPEREHSPFKGLWPIKTRTETKRGSGTGFQTMFFSLSYTGLKPNSCLV